jgi:hypothetical protein
MTVLGGFRTYKASIPMAEAVAFSRADIIIDHVLLTVMSALRKSAARQLKIERRIAAVA